MKLRYVRLEKYKKKVTLNKQNDKDNGNMTFQPSAIIDHTDIVVTLRGPK